MARGVGKRKKLVKNIWLNESASTIKVIKYNLLSKSIARRVKKKRKKKKKKHNLHENIVCAHAVCTETDSSNEL